MIVYCLLCFGLLHSQSFGQSFFGLGDLPGGTTESYASAISSDGKVVAGTSAAANGTQPFRWTAADGLMALAYLPTGGSTTYAKAISGNGSVVVGYGPSASGEQAFRWTAAEGMTGLGDLPGGTFRSQARGTSMDGTVVVGYSQSAAGSEAFRWTISGGMIGLGDLAGGGFSSEAYGVSADGRVVVGRGHSNGGGEAFRWTAADGMVGLGFLFNADQNFSVADGISADGSVIFGHAWASSGGTVAFRWTAEGGMVGLGDLPGAKPMGSPDSRVYAASADGSVLVGYGTAETGVRATLWTQANGLRGLYDVFTNDYRLDLTDWRLYSAEGISADGSVIVGTGIHNGNYEAWMAIIPEPSALTLTAIAFGILGLFRRQRAKI